jgi:hypothetical protein
MLKLDSTPVRVSFTGRCPARNLRDKINSFTDLFGTEPVIHVKGAFDCTDDVTCFCRSAELVTCVGTKYVEVDLGEEGRCKFDPATNDVTYLFSPS